MEQTTSSRCQRGEGEGQSFFSRRAICGTDTPSSAKRQSLREQGNTPDIPARYRVGFAQSASLRAFSPPENRINLTPVSRFERPVKF